MNDHETEALLEIIAWQVMIVSVFRNTERQTLNLLLSILGISSVDESTRFIEQIFELVRKGIIYIPEARLEIFHDAPELVDVYLIQDFDTAMKGYQKLFEITGDKRFEPLVSEFMQTAAQLKESPVIMGQLESQYVYTGKSLGEKWTTAKDWMYKKLLPKKIQYKFQEKAFKNIMNYNIPTSYISTKSTLQHGLQGR